MSTVHIRILAGLALAYTTLAPFEARGALILINNGLPPPSSANVIDSQDDFRKDFVIVRNAGCDAPDLLCPTPGKATSVALRAGGVVGEDLDVRDSSSLQIDGGAVGFFLNVFESAMVRMAGGSVAANVILRNSTTMEMEDGLVQGCVFGFGSSLSVLRGGSVLGDVLGMESASVVIRGGALAGALVAFDDATIFVAGENFAVDGEPVPVGVLAAGTGVLAGTLASGDPIESRFFHAGTPHPLGDPATGTIHLVAAADPIMQVEFEGTVHAGFDTSNVLGLGQDLNGRTLRGSFQYLPGAAPSDGDAGANVANHESMSPVSSDWFSLPVIRIDSAQLPAPDFGLISPPDPSSDEDFAQIRLEDDGGAGLEGATYVRFRSLNDGIDLADYTVQLDLFGPTDLLQSADLSEPVAVTDFSGTTQNNFLASLSTPEAFEVVVSEFELTTLTVTPLPEPDAWVGLVSCLGLLAVLRRLRARTA